MRIFDDVLEQSIRVRELLNVEITLRQRKIELLEFAAGGHLLIDSQFPQN